MKTTQTNIEKKYNTLLKRYQEAINIIYDITPTSDYTPDYMTYDYDGFLEFFNNDDYFYFKQLKEAVNKSELYVKYLNHSYNNTFG